MTDSLEGKLALPLPQLPRWQPLRLGLVNLFLYDSEEFWFCDGHLLLRGNNGTGKSKVLSMTLPFLFDAHLRPSRIEPDGDANKKMSWNLLLGNKHERRMGYTWIEFGRMDEHGEPKFLTLGCGLSAASGRPHVDNWFFILDDHRINQDLWLTNKQRVVLTKERLKEALGGRGQVFPSADAYRRAVDDRLFLLGGMRYAALMDTLVQLRQPQLSKKPDETSLSNALTESLPPLSADLLADVAEAMNQLEEDRRQLEEYQQLAAAVDRFNKRYSVYASIQSRRQAGLLRAAQTTFDNASRALNTSKTRLEEARQIELTAIERYEAAEREWQRLRARQDELMSDPRMQDARRLDQLTREVGIRVQDVDKAQRAVETARQSLQDEIAIGDSIRQRVAKAEHDLLKARAHNAQLAGSAGIGEPALMNVLAAALAKHLATLSDSAVKAGLDELRRLAEERRNQVAHLRRRHSAVLQATQDHDQQLRRRGDLRDEADEASARREMADAEVENQGELLIVAWQKHLDILRQLQISDKTQLIADLAAWVIDIEGKNPALSSMLSAQQEASLRLADARNKFEVDKRDLKAEREELEAESERLRRGEDALPPASTYRSSSARTDFEGAPLWQLVEFEDTVDDSHRAGLEAALEVSGLLDAWVNPDGILRDADGNVIPLQSMHDTQLVPRGRVSASLRAWLRPASENSKVTPAIVAQLLQGVACALDDISEAEAWISPHGRFRLGILAGNWSKPAAVFIGFAAREAARKRRLGDIAKRMTELLIAAEANAEQLEKNERCMKETRFELEQAPSDGALLKAHATAAANAEAWRLAIERAERAEREYQEALQRLQNVRHQLAQDAADLHLPLDEDELPAIEKALTEFGHSSHDMFTMARDLRTAICEHDGQLGREIKAREATEHSRQELFERLEQASEAQARLELLRESVGAEVDELQNKLSDARTQVKSAEGDWRHANDDKSTAGQQRAALEATADSHDSAFLDAAEKRQQAIEKLQHFMETEFIAIALPGADLPDAQHAWTIDPALTLARRIEQVLTMVKDDDDSWGRIQRLVGEEFTELNRALGPLHHQALLDMTEYGMVVRVLYQNRTERPDRLGEHLLAEIAERRELLTAREREIFENHLQAEIAAAVQHLMRDADRQVVAINSELERRPTSTGVKFHLKWIPLSEADGGPVGLEAARQRLLHTGADLWSDEDRRVVGAMLQQRISAERERADAAGGGSILDQLARALDYRRWHRFSVERWQDGQWRKLSGPASSGERALGLTVPLFAAVATFYGQDATTHAPRLVLLDEAFAGIDDDARAHCMALIKEFDLDFLITSEREWACYAALPGVSICQLQRRPGIDAVHLSRWTWNGKSRLSEPDPNRRFADVPP
jgi:uncharacterized protein (TIGR02680 family)